MFDRDTFYCPNCGTIDHPMTITRGSFWVEVMLWLFFLVPGLIYSVWRLSTRYDGCPACGYRDIIPPDSPRAQAEMKALGAVR